MCPVWTPLKQAPCPAEIQCISCDAMIILQALREAHRKKQEAWLKTQDIPDPKVYYKTIYEERFKQESISPRGEPRSKTPHEVMDTACSTPTFNNGIKVKTECRASQGLDNPVTEMPIQRSMARSLPNLSDSDHLHEVKTSQDFPKDVSLRNSFKEHLAPNQDRDTDREKHLTCTNLERASFRGGLPQQRFEASDAVSSEMPDNPLIDTDHSQESINFSHTSAKRLPGWSIAKTCPQQGISVRNELKQFRENTRKGILANTVPLRCCNDDVFITKEFGGCQKEGRVGDRDTEGKEGEHLDDLSQDAQRCPDQWHPTGDLRCQSLESGVAAMDQDRPALNALRSACDFANREETTRKTASKKRVGKTSHVKPITNELEGMNVLPLGMADVSVQQLSAEKILSIDQLVCGSSHVAAGKKHQVIRDVAKMTVTERLEVWTNLSASNEVMMCILYKDGSSQLREPVPLLGKRKDIGSQSGEAECLVFAYSPESDLHKKSQGGERSHQDEVLSDSLELISIPLTSKQDKEMQKWTRETLLLLMFKESVKKICFDAQEMIHALICSFGLDHITVSSRWLVMDPKIAVWLLDADHPPITFSDLLSKYLPDPLLTKKRSTICHDLWLLGAAMKHLFYSLNEAGLWQLFYDLEMRLCPILAAMEVQGICVSSKTLKDYAQILQNKLQEVEQQAYKAAGHSFHITSHSQLRQVLFEELKIDKKYQGRRLARTNIHNLKSTSESVLVKLQSFHPLPKLVLKYRQLLKLKSTYVDGILDCIDDGYIHTSWEQTSAATGRLQSANPNIQNIPKQPFTVEEGRTDGHDGPGVMTILARTPFISHEGWSFVAADFQSIELRVLAHLSHDPVLIQSFNKPDCTDIFVELTSQWLGIAAADVTTADREKTKRIVYSVIYGVGPDKLAETLSVSREEAKTFTRSFLRTFRGVSSFSKSAISCCQRHGFVQTIFRRRRLIANINSSDFHVRSHAERQCVNFVVQGSAADICKFAMIQVIQALSTRPQIQARLVAQIHDELLFEVADSDVQTVQGILKTVMEGTEFDCSTHIQLQVPLPVSITTGTNWGQMA